MKLINIALLSTTLALGFYSTSLPTYAADDAATVAVDGDTANPPDNFEAPPSGEDDTAIEPDRIVDTVDMIKREVPTTDGEDEQSSTTDEDPDLSVGLPVIIDDSGMGVYPDKEVTATQDGDTGDEDVDFYGGPIDGVYTMSAGGPRGTAENQRDVTSQDLPLAVADNSSSSNGATNNFGPSTEPRCKRGFLKCLFGTK